MSQKFINAIDRLNFAAEQAHRLADNAEQYLAAMSGAARPQVEIGAFYVTYDGSLVAIVKRYTKCTCPGCTGRVGVAVIFGQQVQVQLPAPPEDPEHVEQPDEPLLYVTVILRGGHGIKGMRGESPGDHYSVDAAGLATCMPPDGPPGVNLISNADLAVAALSLKQRLAISMMPVETPTQGAQQP